MTGDADTHSHAPLENKNKILTVSNSRRDAGTATLWRLRTTGKKKN
jgi:hypothetical protein